MTRWCRSTEAAQILGVSPRTVIRLAEAGAIPAHRFGRATWWLYDRNALTRMASLTPQQPPNPTSRESDHADH